MQKGKLIESIVVLIYRHIYLINHWTEGFWQKDCKVCWVVIRPASVISILYQLYSLGV